MRGGPGPPEHPETTARKTARTVTRTNARNPVGNPTIGLPGQRRSVRIAPSLPSYRRHAPLLQRRTLALERAQLDARAPEGLEHLEAASVRGMDDQLPLPDPLERDPLPRQDRLRAHGWLVKLHPQPARLELP